MFLLMKKNQDSLFINVLNYINIDNEIPMRVTSRHRTYIEQT